MKYRGGKMYKIIVVGDETLTLKLLSSMITKIADNCELCGTFESADEAIRYMNNNRVDIIFSDIAMPGINGLDFLEYVDSKFVNIRFIIISAYRGFDYVKSAFRNNAYEYILKPVNFTELKKVINDVTAELDKIKDNQLIEVDENVENYKNPIIADAIKYIQENYNNDFSLVDITNALNISQFYFVRLFKKETEQTFVTYLSKYRCMKAKQMMDNSSESIAKIGEQCGFNNYTSFYRTFKKIEGITPQQYKQNNGGVLDEK